MSAVWEPVWEGKMVTSMGGTETDKSDEKLSVDVNVFHQENALLLFFRIICML